MKKSKHPSELANTAIKHSKIDAEQKVKIGIWEEKTHLQKKTGTVQQLANWMSKDAASYTFNKKTFIITLLFLFCGLLFFVCMSCFNVKNDTVNFAGSSVEETGREEIVFADETDGQDERAFENGVEELFKKLDTLDIADLDADYYIDYDDGTIPLGDLPIGARVVDPTWEWEYRIGNNYSGPGEKKPVTWIAVAKNHYDGMEAHVTLLAEELIGLYTFDNSTNRSHKNAQFGYNHWGDSGKAFATRGIRPWLNSSGIHSGEGFYQSFSESFKGAVLKTTLPNKEWKNGTVYSTSDHVFIPSATELGYNDHITTYIIGSSYSYFIGAGTEKRFTDFPVRVYSSSDDMVRQHHYWTRSPGSIGGYYVVIVHKNSGVVCDIANHFGNTGVRPALNLKSEILVSEIRN